MKKPLLSALTSVSACLLHFYDTLCLRKRSVGGGQRGGGRMGGGATLCAGTPAGRLKQD